MGAASAARLDDARYSGRGERVAGVRADGALRAEVIVLRPRRVVPPGGAATGRGRPPIRLTRRGRVVVATAMALLAAGVVTLAWLALAGGAEASGRGGAAPASTRHALTRVVVMPGQTLWAIAERAEPAADPRVVIQQIMDLNSLPGTDLQIGQVLWVPRG